ncbi:MAG: Uma2 family endonuclease [Bryobacterales bacterium]|nr:Uma2 family endonuclease [Bryobacterales bacterium]
MSTRALVSPEEYLHMTFEGPDSEYVDGEILERTMPNEEHSAVQVRFVEIVYELKKRGIRIFARTELRHQLAPSVFRIPDVAIFEGVSVGASIPTAPPLAVVEIISPDDRFIDISAKLHQYQEWGVPHIWIVNPQDKTFAIFRNNSLTDADRFEIPEYQVAISSAEFF